MTTNGNGHVNGTHVLRKVLDSKQKPSKKKATSKSAPNPDINNQLNGRLGEYIAKATAGSMTKVVAPVAKAVRENRKAADQELNALRMEVSELKSRPTWFKVPTFLLAFDKHMSAQEQEMLKTVESMLRPADVEIDIDLTTDELELNLQPEPEPLQLQPPVQQEPASTHKETRSWPLPKFLRRSAPTPQPQG